jgi:protein TonB
MLVQCDIISGSFRMHVRSLLAAAAMFAAGSALAQTPDAKTAQAAANLEVLQKLYPPRALAAREEGAVGFKVTLDSKGAVSGCEVTHSSGHPLLDQETCNLITLHALFKGDTGAGISQVRTHEGLIAWKLPASTTQLRSPQTANSDPVDKVVCKKVVRTGTLSGVERTCLTIREWGRQSDETKMVYEDMQGAKGSTHGN